MKRTFYAVAGLLLVTAMVLSACGGGAAPAAQQAAATSAPAQAAQATEAPSGSTAVTTTASTAGGAKVTVKAILDSTTRDFDQAAVDYCAKQTGVDIQIVNGPQSATDRLAQYLQFFSAQSPDIDLVQIDVIWPGILAEHLVDLKPYLGDNIKNYFDRIIQNNTVDGKLVGIPWFTDAGVMYYRTDLLKKYGYDNPPKTWKELDDMATKIQDGERKAGNPDFWGYVWQGSAYEGLTCDALEWQVSNGGGNIVEPDGKITINNPQAAAAFDMAHSWVNRISPPGVISYQEEDARGVWQAGNAAFMRNWPYAYSLGNAADSAIKDKFAVEPVPAGDGPGARNADTLGGWQMAVSKYSKHVDEAAKVAVCLTSPEAQKIRATQGSMLPTIGNLYKDADVLKANPFFGQLFDVFNGGAVARPSTVTGDKYNQVSTIYFTEVSKVLSGQQKGQDAVQSIEKQLKDLLQ